MLDDAGMVGTTTPAGKPKMDLVLLRTRVQCGWWGVDGLGRGAHLRTSPYYLHHHTVQEEAPAVNDLEQRFAALRK